MWVLSILGLLLAAFLVKRKFKTDFYLALPFATAAMILILYILAFFSALKYIDIAALIEIIGFVIYYSRCSKTKKEDLRSQFLEFIKLPQLWCVLIICIITTILTIGQYVSWWDDLNYWATDAKALYYTSGFSGKYGNVAPEFGDYPPAVQLFKWWFLHFSNNYIEGLQFAGYYCMNFIFMLPIIREIKSKNIVIHLISCIILTFIPSIIDQFWAYGTCADVTMGILYGAVLAEFYRNRKKTKDIYFTSIYVALLLCVLVLVKTVAVEWVIFSIIFGIIIGAVTFYPVKKTSKSAGISAISIIFPFLTLGSWMLFCLLNRRVAKLTSAGVKMAASGKYTLPGDAKERIIAYVKGFFEYPMHGGNGYLLDLSSGILLIAIFAIMIIFAAVKFTDKKETIKLCLFALITAFAAYGIILIGHLTIFQTENQYLEAETMAKSIERYGAPFSLGFIMLMISIALSQQVKKKRLLSMVVAAFVLVTADYNSIAYAYGGYYMQKSETLESRESMIGDVESAFIMAVQGQEELYGSRLLFIQDADEIHWVKNTYINFYVSPVPVVYSSVYSEDISKETIENLINTMHASYIYIQEMDADIKMLLQDYMLDGESIEYNTVYEIVTENGVTYFRII